MCVENRALLGKFLGYFPALSLSLTARSVLNHLTRMSSFLKRLRGKGAPVGDEAKKGEEKAGERPGGAAPPPQHHHNHPRQHTPTPRRPHRGGGKEGEEEEEDEEDGEGEADIEDEDEPEEGGGDDYDDGEDFAEEDANTFGDAEEDRAEENISYYDDDEGDEEEEEEEEEEDEEELVLSPEEDEYSGEDYSGESGEDGEGEYSGDDGYDDEEGLDEDEEVARAEAQPFDILNAIACALYEPDESDSDDEGNSVSDVDPAQNDDEGAEHTAFSAEELKKIRLVFAHCDTMNLRHLNEDQFGIALALLGQTESMDQLKKLYDHEARADGLDDAGFEKCLAKLRTKAKGDDQMARIREVRVGNTSLSLSFLNSRTRMPVVAGV